MALSFSMPLVKKFFTDFGAGCKEGEIVSFSSEECHFSGEFVSESQIRRLFCGTLTVGRGGNTLIYTGSFWSDGCVYAHEFLSNICKVVKGEIRYNRGGVWKTVSMFCEHGEAKIFDNAYVESVECSIEFPIVPNKAARVPCPDGGYVEINVYPVEGADIMTIDQIKVKQFTRRFLDYDADGNVVTVELAVTLQKQEIVWKDLKALRSKTMKTNLAAFLRWFEGRSHKNLLRALGVDRPSLENDAVTA